MAERIMREIERYWCEDDDGQEYIVVEYQHYLIIHPRGDSRQELAGLKECRLLDGRHVNVVGDGVFKILDTDTIIREA